jgi:long-chain acyl-CoA synthetase
VVAAGPASFIYQVLIMLVAELQNIMKLAQGEYVALEKIENLYSSTPIVAQIYVHGDSLQSFLVAVLVPDPIQLAGIAGSLTGTKVSPENTPALAAVCKDERVVSHILSILTKVADQSGLKGYAAVIFHLDSVG